MPVNRRPLFEAVTKLTGQTWAQRGQAAVDAFDRAIDEATGEKTARLYPAAPPPAPVKPKFYLGDQSIDEMENMKPELKQVIRLAITLTMVDFTVRGPRTKAEQAAAVKAGNSRTMKSKHLVQADGYIWAADLIAVVNGVIKWEPFNLYAAIAFAMDQAATQLGFAEHIRWGCAWDRVLADFGGSPEAYMNEARAYAARHAGSDLIDGPHFEWVP